MASLCRSAVMAGSRSIAARSRTLTRATVGRTVINSPLFSSASAIPRASRVLSALGSVESSMPLHSAVASARLRSNIAVDSSCWSWLSQGLATPL